jgi:hypothetical protein
LIARICPDFEGLKRSLDMLALVQCVRLIAALASAPAQTPADATPRVLVVGRVIDDSVAPIEGAWVQLTSRATGRILSVRTNARGEYSFGVVDDYGCLDVLVRRIGYRPGRFTLSHQAGTDELVGNVQLESLASTIVS